MEKTPPGIISLAPDQFSVSIGDRSYIVTVVDDRHVRVDGHDYVYSFRRSSLAAYSLILDSSVYDIALDPGDDTRGGAHRQEIAVNGVSFEPVVDDRRSLLRKSVLKDRSAAAASQSIKAPMPGKVVRVEVQMGDRVQPGTGLVILEAMKMENEIRSTGTGIVELIKVETGKAVEKGELLMSIRPE